MEFEIVSIIESLGGNKTIDPADVSAGLLSPEVVDHLTREEGEDDPEEDIVRHEDVADPSQQPHVFCPRIVHERDRVQRADLFDVHRCTGMTCNALDRSSKRHIDD